MTIKKSELGLSAMTKLLGAMYAARDVAMEKLGSLYKPTVDLLRKRMAREIMLFGLEPIHAMALHVGPGIDDKSMMLWLAATAEEYIERAAAEPAKAVG